MIKRLSLKNKLPILIRTYRATSRLRRKIDNYLTSVTDDLIKRETEIQNHIIKNITLSVTKKFRNSYKKFLINYESDVYLFTGKSIISGDQFNLLYIGNGDSIKYLVKSFFNDNDVQKVPLGRVISSNIKKTIELEQQDADLIILERNINENWVPQSGEWIRTPRWVRMVYRRSENETIESFMRKVKKNIKTNLSRIRKAKFKSLISKQLEDLEYFYNSMYLPLIKMRYPDYGDILSLDICQKLMSSGFLLFCCLPDGKKVAGELILTYDKSIYGLINGILDGDESLYHMGALSSLYFFKFEYAFSCDYNRIDQGNTRPFKSGGLYLHKRKWGYTPEKDPWGITDWLFWIPNNSKDAFNWVNDNQFLQQFAEIHGEQIELIYSHNIENEV